jgi:hypothetical protein
MRWHDLSCNVAVQCVFAILRYALDQTFVLKVVLYSCEEMERMLVSQETSLGIVNNDLLPT